MDTGGTCDRIQSSSTRNCGTVYQWPLLSTRRKQSQPASGSSGNETARGRSIATRLTDAEFGEVEAAAGIAGKKVGEWLREAALAQARGTHHDEQTDQILLAEMMGMRSLMLNLFARASEGPLTTEDLRKMSAYSDSIKEQRAQDYMAERRRRNSPKPTDKP
jgi:hypothetical protein